MVGTLAESRSIRGEDPVAPPLPSMVIKSGSAYTQKARSFSILPAAIFTPTGRPSEAILSWATRLFKSSLVFIPGNLDGAVISCPTGLFRTFAISWVTFSPGRWPPIPGLVP